MKTLLFTISHANFEQLMCEHRIARLFSVKDLGHERDHYEVTALVRQDDLDAVIACAADRPRWVKWPGG
jgi:hypothetical protein